MPSIASESCHITSGCSGLPKFRQLTSASGRAPAQATLSADSATVAAVPERGDRRRTSRGWRRRSTRAPCPSRRSPGAASFSTRGVGLARADDGVEEQLVVVLAVDPGAGSESSASRSDPQSAGRREPARVVGAGAARGRRAARSAARSGGRRRRATPRAARPRPRPCGPSRIRSRPTPSGSRRGDPADRRWPRPPSGGRPPRPLERASGVDDRQHPLLALARHHLDRAHARLAAGHGGDVDVHPEARRARPSRSSRRPARRRRGPGCRRRDRPRAARGRPR